MLTDTACKNAKPQEKPYKLADSAGLYLLVTPTAKLWNLSYRFGGKQKTLAIGPYPTITLGTARDKRQDAKRLLVDGKDPSALKREAREAQANVKTFGDFADAWLADETKNLKCKTLWVGYLKARFADRLVADITRENALVFLREFDADGRLATRDGVRQVAEAIFTYADTKGTGFNPFRKDSFFKSRLKTHVKKNRPALTNTDDVVTLFQKLHTPYARGKNADALGEALRFIALTAVRVNEVCSAEWSEIDFAKALWVIPASKMKMDRPHLVPLSTQAIALLKRVHDLTGTRRFVFQSTTWGEEPLAEAAFNVRLQSLGYDTKTQHCTHGFRSTFSTLLNRETDRDDKPVWSENAIEVALAHITGGVIKRTYDRVGEFAYINERTRMLQHWADRVERMVAGDNVIPLPERRAI